MNKSLLLLLAEEWPVAWQHAELRVPLGGGPEQLLDKSIVSRVIFKIPLSLLFEKPSLELFIWFVLVIAGERQWGVLR